MRIPPELRSCTAHPGFSARIVVICALAVATTTSVFSAVDGILFRPPAGVERPSQLFRLYQGVAEPPRGETVSRTFSYPQFTAIRARVVAMAQVVGVSASAVSVGLGPGARSAMAEFVTSEFFRVLGVRLLRGRSLSSDDARAPESDAVAVVSERYWRGGLQGRPDVLGLPIVVDGRSYSIIGVASQAFEGIGGPPVDLWLPLSAAGMRFHGETWEFNAGDRWIQVIGRYRGTATGALVAASATQAIVPSVPQLGVVTASGGARALVGPIQLAWGPGRSLQARISTWLLFIAGAVLLISCSNIANLYVVRLSARRRELAVRVALGATMRALFGQLFVETSLLSGLGGLLGIAIASLANSALQSLMSQGSTGTVPRIDLRVVLVAVASTVAVALLSAALPLVGMGRTQLAVSLQEGGPHATHRRSRLRSGLAATQVALAAVLLVAAGLFMHTLRAVFAIDLGMQPESLLVASVDLASVGRPQREIDAFYAEALERCLRLPTVAFASVGATVPFQSGFAVYTAAPGARPLSEGGGSLPYVNVVTPDFFLTLGMRIIQGRGFSTTDDRGGARVAVVSRALAAALWPGADPLGKCIQVGGPEAPCTSVVGVAADAARDRPTEAPPLQYFLPLAQQDTLVSTRALFLRTRVPPETVVGDVRRTLQALAPDLPYPFIIPLKQLTEPYVRPWRTAASLFTLFAALAVFLAVHGVQSVISYAVVERRQELAVRIALGGRPGDVLLIVIKQGLRLSAIGIVFGLGAAAVAAPKVAPLLFATSALQPSAYGLAGGAMLLCGVLAAGVPGIRAATIAPGTVLRG